MHAVTSRQQIGRGMLGVSWLRTVPVAVAALWIVGGACVSPCDKAAAGATLQENPPVAQQPKDAVPPAAKAPQDKGVDELRAELARVYAELLEARQQAAPNWQRVQELQQRAWQLREQIAARQGGQIAPPRLGLGAAGGAGLGRGTAGSAQARAGWGRGGPGVSGAPGGGRGRQGWQGAGPGGPRGQGGQRGRGMGPQGPGFGFIDRNGNGICDYLETRP